MAGVSPRTATKTAKIHFLGVFGPFWPVNRKLRLQEAQPSKVAVVWKLRNANMFRRAKTVPKLPSGAELRPKKQLKGSQLGDLNQEQR